MARETQTDSPGQDIRTGAALFVLALALRLAVVAICASNVCVPGLSYVFRPLAISGGDATDYDTMAQNLLGGKGLVEKEGAATRQPLFPLQTVERWAFDAELIFIAQRLGLRIAEVPVRWIDSAHTKVSMVSDGLKAVVDLARIRWRHRGLRRHTPRARQAEH